MVQVTPIVRNLLIINILVYIIDTNLFNLSETFALRSFLSPLFLPFQYVSYMFLHGSFGHLLSNMFGLFIFGPLLERMWGSKRFLIFYLVTGIGAGFLFSAINYFEIANLVQDYNILKQFTTPQTFIDFLSSHSKAIYEANRSFINNFVSNPDNPKLIADSLRVADYVYEVGLNTPMVGASGAIFGILMAFGLLFPNTELFLLFVPFPIKAKYFVAFYGLYELYAGIQNNPGDNIAHFAHLGGMLFAYILLRLWKTQRNNFF